LLTGHSQGRHAPKGYSQLDHVGAANKVTLSYWWLVGRFWKLSPIASVMAEHPTASWEAMQDGNVFYRRQQLYSIQGKLPPLEEHIIAGCRCGGPIGFVPSAIRPFHALPKSHICSTYEGLLQNAHRSSWSYTFQVTDPSLLLSWGGAACF
jgi:hypothetical protein